MRDIYQAVKACVQRNILQTFYIVTLIALIAMNKSSAPITEDSLLDESADIEVFEAIY